jgi:hypothetical protein
MELSSPQQLPTKDLLRQLKTRGACSSKITHNCANYKRHGRLHFTVNSAYCGLIPRRFTSRTELYEDTSVIVGITHQPDATFFADFQHGLLHDAACHDEQPLSAIYKRKQWIKAWITVGIQARPCQICQSVHLVLTLLRNVIYRGYKNQNLTKNSI